MESKELRLGNLIFDIDGHISPVTSINNKTVAVNDEHIAVACDLLNPIPLTDYWIDRLNFEHDHEKRVNVITLKKINNEFYYDSNEYKIQYVHELQNIYFVLTGEELLTK